MKEVQCPNFHFAKTKLRCIEFIILACIHTVTSVEARLDQDLLTQKTAAKTLLSCPRAPLLGCVCTCVCVCVSVNSAIWENFIAMSLIFGFFFHEVDLWMLVILMSFRKSHLCNQLKY